MRMVKEVSDKVIVIFIVVAVIVSVLGTFIVYTQTSNNVNNSPNAAVKEPSSVGYVGVVVTPSQSSSTGDT